MNISNSRWYLKMKKGKIKLSRVMIAIVMLVLAILGIYVVGYHMFVTKSLATAGLEAALVFIIEYAIYNFTVNPDWKIKL